MKHEQGLLRYTETIRFTYFAKMKNRHDFKREWVTVRCQEDIK